MLSLGLDTAQRYLPEALVVAQNSSDGPNPPVMLLVAGLPGLVLLTALGGELGRRSQAEVGD